MVHSCVARRVYAGGGWFTYGTMAPIQGRTTTAKGRTEVELHSHGNMSGSLYPNHESEVYHSITRVLMSRGDDHDLHNARMPKLGLVGWLGFGPISSARPRRRWKVNFG